MERLIDQMSTATPDSELYKKCENDLKEMLEKQSSYCVQCVKCTAGCPAMRLLELHPNEIMANLNLGFIDELVKSDIIWCCVTCFKCKERCPQEVSPADAIYILRSMSVAKGLPIPEGYSKVLQAILQKGMIQDQQEIMVRLISTNKKKFMTREKLGLPEAPTPENMQKFQMALMNVLQKSL